MMDKVTLRTLYKAKGLALSDEEQEILDNKLLASFKGLHLPRQLEYIMGFMPMKKFNEPDILPLIEYIQQYHHNIKITFPKVRPGTAIMDAIYTDETTSFALNSIGIREPDNLHTIPQNQLDLVFIPLLPFDKK